MKKLLAMLGILIMTSTTVTSVLTNINNQQMSNNHNNNSNSSSQTYQTQTDWDEYIKDNDEFLSLMREVVGLQASDDFVGTTMSLDMVDNKGDKSVGTLLMNGEIRTTDSTPSMVSQHIIDNSTGSAPITVNYDSKQVTTESRMKATISSSAATLVGTETKLDVDFFSEGVNTKLKFDFSASLSASNTVTETLNFDKFNTTVPIGDKEEVDYIVIQNQQSFNMILKAKLDTTKLQFNFKNHQTGQTKAVPWMQLASNSNYNQYFAREIDGSKYPWYDQDFISINHIYDPNIPIANQLYDTNNIYANIGMTFTLNDYSTLIKQTKL